MFGQSVALSGDGKTALVGAINHVVGNGEATGRARSSGFPDR